MLSEFRQHVGVSGLRRINQHLLGRLLHRQGVQPQAVALMDATDLPASCGGNGGAGYQTAIANHVPLAEALDSVLATARTWCFRAKDTLKPFLGESHNSLWRPTGFVTSLRVPEDYAGLLAVIGTLGGYFTEHPDRTNDSDAVNATAARAAELQTALRSAKAAVDAQDSLLVTRHQEQEVALEALRDRLRGLTGELKQLIGEEDARWRRFGFNIPDEPETPAQPGDVAVNNTTAGQLLVSCGVVPFAARYRWFVAKVGTTAEPQAAGTSNEPLFVIEGLEAARYNVFALAVNLAGNEGPLSKAVTAEMRARAVA